MHSEVGELKYNTSHLFDAGMTYLKDGRRAAPSGPLRYACVRSRAGADKIADKVNAPSNLVLRGAGEAYGDAEGDQWA